MTLDGVKQLCRLFQLGSSTNTICERGDRLRILAALELNHAQSIKDLRTARVQFERMLSKLEGAIEVLALHGVNPCKIVACNAGLIASADCFFVVADCLVVLSVALRLQRPGP